ncbi:MAG: UPF0182 family protein [Candidatus Latescibacteria bacterium]|nr:UPF0182 family protein [Candidatus Latescibacterota bacterium]
MPHRAILGTFLGAIAVLALIFLSVGAGIYTNWLWFLSLGYESVYWTLLKTKFYIFLTFWALFALIAGVNVGVARRYGRRTRNTAPRILSIETFPDLLQGRRHLWMGWGAVILVLGALMGLVSAQMWPAWLRYDHPIPFGVTDPLFGRDVGYYVFSLPLLNFLRGWLIAAALLSTFLALVSYYTDRALVRQETQWEREPFVESHLSAAAAGIALLVAWGYHLKKFDLLYASGGLIPGAGYTEANVQLFAYRVLLVMAVGVAILCIYNIHFKGWRLPLYGVLGFGVCLVGLSWVLPVAVQQFVVRPNELVKQTPYIRHAIESTRRAYGLDRIEERDFPSSKGLTLHDVQANPLIIKNIRLWDVRPLLDTYRQIQEIRPYYQFADVDVDRYAIQGEYRQVMVSSRELSIAKLPERANTWQNRHLVYTHGYGICMSPVNEIAGEGLPELFIKDLPPVSRVGVDVKRPEVYFGELTDDYIIIGTGMPEFDYPRGEANVYTTYLGEGGVSISSFLRRLAFAWKFEDIKILLSGDITPRSQILFNRQIVDRVRQVAPFLDYDADPYIVTVDGRLFWIQDAYTFTNMYPYSEPFDRRMPQGKNYIRNAVKVVTDAYTGAMTFYVSDPEDPLIRSYQEIFPGLFQPIGRMPEGIRAHVRYPEGLFKVQVTLNNTYHMTDPQVFYNQEDAWSVSKEVYGTGNQPQLMSPYYVIMKFPDKVSEEFVLMLPVTPATKDNMIAWIFARCDASDYGKLVVYKLPKEKLVYGPMQITARIDQDPVISRDLTLWAQKGSSVIRGNMMVVPIHNSFLYVQPLYLKAEQSELPELKRVIVSNGERVAMEETLDRALASVFGGTPSEARPEGADGTTQIVSSVRNGADATVSDLASEAVNHFQKTQERLKAGDFAGYGQAVKELERVLERMKESTGGK